jgi:hypothetical protein
MLWQGVSVLAHLLVDWERTMAPCSRTVVAFWYETEFIQQVLLELKLLLPSSHLPAQMPTKETLMAGMSAKARDKRVGWQI